MAFDAYMEIDKVKGESMDDQHKNWIEVDSYSFSVAMSGVGVGTAGGHASGRADFSDFTVTKKLDAASPNLALACAKGDALGTVTLELCRAGGEKFKFLSVEMTDAMITNVSQSGSQGGDVPAEDVTFGYSTIKWTYTQQGPDQQAIGDVSGGWDLKANKPL